MSQFSSRVSSPLAHPAADSYRSLVESVVDYAIYIVDPARRIVSWNSGAERIYGYGAEEIIGQPFSTVFAPEDVADGRADELCQLSLTSGNRECGCQCARKDQSLFGAVVSVSVLKDHCGNHIGFSVVARTDSEKQRPGAASPESDKLHRLLLDTLPDALFVSSDGRITYGNPAFVELLGASRSAELMDRDAMSIFHPNYHEAIRQRIEATRFQPCCGYARR